MKQVAAAIDDEARVSFLAQHGRDEIDEISFADRANVDHEWAPGKERCTLASNVIRPTRSCEGMAADSGSVRRQRIGPVIAEQFQVTPDQRIDSTVGAGMQPIVKIEELDRVLREGEAPALG